MAAEMITAPFRVGRKELYLPNITIALLRTPALSPNYAKFHVPLWFSKLDLRDYLYHVYNVRITSVRSYVKQQRVEMEEVHGQIKANRWHRPRAQKFMTVELERAFVWPAEPEDWSAWNKEQMEASMEMSERLSEKNGSRRDLVVNGERRRAMREQARALLEGSVEWKPREGVFGMVAR